jgi:ParB family chromosome partitioning protein
MSMPTIRTLSRDGTLKRTDVGLFARLEDIHERPGFNIIRDYSSPKYQADVDALVAYLEAGGTVEALEVLPRAEGGVWIVQGHTRRFAYQKMVERGTLIRDPKGDAWIRITPFVGNDAEQILRQATSTKRAETDVLGLGRVYNKLLSMGWTVQQIAERSGEQVATIKRVLDLAAGNTDVHEQVKAGTVSPTIAAAAVRKHGDKAGEVLATQLEQAKKLGKKKVTAAVVKPKGPTPAMVQRLLCALEDPDWVNPGAAQNAVLQVLADIREFIK